MLKSGELRHSMLQSYEWRVASFYVTKLRVATFSVSTVRIAALPATTLLRTWNVTRSTLRRCCYNSGDVARHDITTVRRPDATVSRGSRMTTPHTTATSERFELGRQKRHDVTRFSVTTSRDKTSRATALRVTTSRRYELQRFKLGRLRKAS